MEQGVEPRGNLPRGSLLRLVCQKRVSFSKIEVCIVPALVAHPI
jgi:hypothetical protein